MYSFTDFEQVKTHLSRNYPQIKSSTYFHGFHGKTSVEIEVDDVVKETVGWIVSPYHILVIHPTQRVPIVGVYKDHEHKRITPVKDFCIYRPDAIDSCPLKTMFKQIDQMIVQNYV